MTDKSVSPLRRRFIEDMTVRGVTPGLLAYVPVLGPGHGRTRQGRLWVYVRDGRPRGGTAAPAAFYEDSPNRKGVLAGAIRYALLRWAALTPCIADGTVEIDNNAAERALRGVALGRKNWLFAGSDRGGAPAAAIYALIETASLNGLGPEVYLRDVTTRIADYPVKRIDELLPWYLPLEEAAE